MRMVHVSTLFFGTVRLSNAEKPTYSFVGQVKVSKMKMRTLEILTSFRSFMVMTDRTEKNQKTTITIAFCFIQRPLKIAENTIKMFQCPAIHWTSYNNVSLIAGNYAKNFIHYSSTLTLSEDNFLRFPILGGRHRSLLSVNDRSSRLLSWHVSRGISFNLFTDKSKDSSDWSRPRLWKRH